MERKGELKRNGLPSLFRNFANENFRGVLTITSSVGEKLITLTENDVTIFCDVLNESSRLGNILQARGLITEEKLDATLQDQKKLDPRPKLGELLVQRGLIAESAISEVRRFQIEEDICDVLSWKKARFNFAGADSAREIHPADFAADQVHHMTIDPDTFFKYVTKVTEDWDAISDRLPTQYLCFKLSAKATENVGKLSSDSQRVLRFLKEGHSVEGVVKQSCLGRIQVCTQVIDLLEKGLIVPASGADLRFMASEHRAQNRYHGALYIYRRLLESPDSQDERPYLENLIEKISETIVRLKQRGEYGEEAVIVSHKEVREKYVFARFKRKAFWTVFGLAGILIIGFLLINSGKSREDLTPQYREIIARVDTLVADGKFNAAIKELDDLYDSMPDKESVAAGSVQEKKARMPGLIGIYLENQLSILNRRLQSEGAERDAAMTSLRDLLEDYPGNTSEQKIKDLIAKYDGKNVPVIPDNKDPAPNTSFAARDELLGRLRKADVLKQQKKYVDAAHEFVLIRDLSPANGDIWKLANEGAKSIRDIERLANDLVKQAEATWAEKKGDQALELIDRALPSFGDLDGVNNAEALKTRWISSKNTAQQIFKSAKDLESQSSIFDAKTRYEQVANNYPQFPISAEAARKAAELKLKCNTLIQLIDSAASAVKAGQFDKAREIYKPLLQSNPLLLVDQHVEIPVSISSFPSHSILKLNGTRMGVTPLNVMIRAGEPFEIAVERPGFSTKKVAGERLTTRELEHHFRLDLDPIVIDFQAPPLKTGTALLAPPAWFENHLLVLNGPELVALDPPSKDILWTVSGLFDPRAALPDTVPPDEKYYWNCRLAPTSYKPGFILLPTRNKVLLEIDLRAPATPQKRSVFGRLGTPPPEIVGTMYIDEHSQLAGKSLLVAAFADGQMRCYLDFDKNDKDFGETWSLPLDPQGAGRPETPAAGLFGYKGSIWSLSGSGMLQAIDPIAGKQVWNRKFPAMSPRSTFSGTPGDPLAALIQRNGKVTLFDLERKEEVWSLPPRQAMEESVGVTIDESGIFVTSRKDDYGELAKYARTADVNATVPTALSSIKLDGYVNLDMAQGKHLYLITHFNKVVAYSKSSLSLVWEFKMKPEMGEPRSIRAFGDYVYVSTDKGKLIVLKSE